jgi:hypothetical protein
LEQVAVVARQLDHLAIFVQAKPIRDHVDVLLGVLKHGIRVRRKIGVLIVKNLRRTDVLLKLHQEALIAYVDVLRVEGFHLVQLARLDHLVAGWGHTQVNKRVMQFGATKAAARCVTQHISRHYYCLPAIYSRYPRFELSVCGLTGA